MSSTDGSRWRRPRRPTPRSSRKWRPFLAKLRGLLEQARNLSAQQSALTASKQEVSKQLRRTIRQGQKLVDVMRTGAQEHFGVDSEKLVEWGLQPFRGRTRKAATTPPEKPDAEAPDSQSP